MEPAPIFFIDQTLNGLFSLHHTGCFYIPENLWYPFLVLVDLEVLVT